MVTSLVVAILILGFLIVFHEFGHFFVAKRVGVGVLKFSVGFGPRLVGIQIGRTEYVISAIPLGGFVKMIGEDPDEEVSAADRELSFTNKSLWRRTAIVLAGPLANLLLAFLAFLAVFAIYGNSEPRDEAIVGGVSRDMPAAAAGLQAGDLVVAVDGAPVANWEKLAEIIRGSDGEPLRFTIDRAGQTLDIDVQPKASPRHNEFGEVVDTAFLIGIERGMVATAVGPLKAVQLAGEQTLWWIRTLVLSIFKMVGGSIPADQIGGPIMIVQAAGEQAQRGLEDLLYFMAIVSVNLGVLNLLPIPILDGGHLFFFAIEGILRRPLAIRHREIAQQVGLVLLVSLMAFAFYNDIRRNLESWWG
jgi:regulator of sigma E protease